MLSVSLREEVQKALGVEWKGFAERHPRLAEVIDQNLLFEQAAACIADDAQFQAAMAEAAGLAQAGSIIADAVKRFVGQWLGKLLG